MDDFAGLLQRDFGLKPQGKSSPMVSSKGSVVAEGGNMIRSSSAGNMAFPGGGGGGVVSGDDPFFSKSSRGFDEVFGGGGGTMGVPPKPRSSSAFSASSVVYDDIFKAPAAPAVANGRSFSAAVDTPIFDDDIFGGVPGVRKVSSSGIDDIFGRSSSPSPPPIIFDDLLGGFGASASAPKQTSTNAPKQTSTFPMESFDDLLPGFGGMDPPKPRPAGGDGKSSSEEFTSKPASADAFDDLLPGFGSSDPLPQPRPTGDAKKSPEQTSSPFVDPDPNPYKENGKSNTVKTGLGGERAEEGLPGFDEFVTSPPPPSATKPPVVAPSSKGSENPLLNRNIVEKKRSETVESPSRSSTRSETLLNRNIVEKKRGETVESPSRSSAQSDTLLNRNIVEKKRIETVESPSRSSTRNETLLNRNIVEKRRSETVTSPPRSTTRSKNVSEAKNNHSLNNNNEARSPKMERVSQSDSPRKKDRKSEESANQVQKAEKKRMGRDYWVSVENIKLATQPSSAPPPTRPLPLPKLKPAENLEAFAAGMSRKPGEDGELEGVASASAAAASAAAMKEAMDKAEAKAKQAKEREREAKLARAKEERERLREAQLREEKEQREKDERAFKERWEREEAVAREREEREAREEKEREARERRRKEQLEKEKEREKERERRAVEKVNQEARERAAAEAQERMERAAKEARDRAAKEARDRAERVAVERATVEARERAAIDAKKAAENKARLERAAVERANAEARERAAAEARERAERIAAAVERANAEAQERAAAEARERAERIAAERAAAAAKENQRRQQDNDLESFFKSNSRADSTPRQRPATAVPTPDIPQPNRGFQSDDNRRPPPGPSEVKKPPASPIDDLTSLFGVARTSEDFQEVAGETAERRKARLERHQRTLDRTAKALEEKNQRDLQVQRDQAERHRLAETVDAEIKRWSMGKEGNIRALLSTLQYVLWPECGWQPVSLTDLITGASVKKVYRKATLCVHPDKVQQKGATIQQKYISEKVFDLLKEAWNKFNSEELF